MRKNFLEELGEDNRLMQLIANDLCKLRASARESRESDKLSETCQWLEGMLRSTKQHWTRIAKPVHGASYIIVASFQNNEKLRAFLKRIFCR